MNYQSRCQHWAGVLSAQSSSGLSKKDFCASRGINAATFYYWQRQLREADTEANVGGFTQLELLEEHELSVYCVGRWVVLRSTSVATLAGIIKALVADA